MKLGTHLLTGAAIGAVIAVSVALGAYTFAPPFQFPADYAWLNDWGRIGVAIAAGWGAFVVTLFLTIFAAVARMFNDMGGGLDG